MYIHRIKIQNFRNFQDVECRLGRHVVLLGENGVGKSNLLHALRLVLDPDLPDSARILDAEDFWSGVTPFGGTEINVTVDLTEYASEVDLLACLADHEIPLAQKTEQPIARITYRFAPRDSLEMQDIKATTKDDYEFSIYGRDDPSNEVGRDVRRFIILRLLPALRDAEGDLRAWRRSPLRPLLEELGPSLNIAQLESAAADIDAVTGAITAQQPLVELAQGIGNRVNDMIGSQHSLVPTLGFTSSNAKELVRSLRLFVDQKRQLEVADTSLGLANVLYLALLLMHIRARESEGKIAGLVLGIEEPEAHLHPQLQRRVFRDLLRGSRPILVSTHSPNIASVAPIDSLVVLRTNGSASTLKSLVEASHLTKQQCEDLAHYLDVTRAEMLFGRGIILVEGDAEKFLVPAIARKLPIAVDLDEFGISVCSVAGTDFLPYARLLSHFEIPYVIVTDGDAEDHCVGPKSPGITRALDILRELATDRGVAQDAISCSDTVAARSQLQALGIFVGTRTLEVDMVANGAGSRLAAAYKELRSGTRDKTLEPLTTNSIGIDDERAKAIVSLVERQGVGKGRFAQRFATKVLADDAPHIKAAILELVSRCKRHDAP